jgi:hypothetical protein
MLLGAIMDQAAIISSRCRLFCRSLSHFMIRSGSASHDRDGEVGLVTPPIGLNAFVVSRYTGRPVHEVFRGVLPHVVAHLIIIALFILFPELILWLPSTMDR